MKTIFQNGLVKDLPYILTEEQAFGIQELEGASVTGKYVIQGDSIKYTMDSALAELYDLFRVLILQDTELDDNEMSDLSVWITESGQNSEFPISSTEFSHLIEENQTPRMYQQLYLVDCQFLIGAIQNLICGLERAFVDYYTRLASVTLIRKHDGFNNYEGIIAITSEESIQVSNVVETYFTKAYSILDLVCKICYEFQYMRMEYESYKKLKSADVLWGDRKRLKINNTQGTVFEKCDCISIIESIRNEIVHNGTWELNPKVFICFKDGKEVERYILFPDIEQGHLATVKNRKHFFSSQMKVNDVLLSIHREFMGKLLTTVKEIHNCYGVNRTNGAHISDVEL